MLNAVSCDAVKSLLIQVKSQSENSHMLNLFPWYQPIIDVASGQICCYEALARTRSEDGRILSAGNLFTSDTLDESEKRKLDHYVRRQALLQAKSLPAGTSVTLNISPKWIDDLDNYVDLPTLAMIEEVGISPTKVIIELTELDGNVERMLAAVQAYRKAGLQVAIDDFGAGFSQLDRVVALEPDLIKLDMRLFKQAVKGGIAEQVVESLAELTAKSGAKLVCEGVETEEEFYFGLRCGAHHMQGYLFAPAAAQFLQNDHFADLVQQLRERFLQQMRAKEARRLTAISNMKSYVVELREQLRLSPSYISSSELISTEETTQVIRFYVCGLQGEQLTPNYTYQGPQNKWDADTGPIGYNWSWRPYFYQLLCQLELDKEAMVVSPPYQDLKTLRPCITLSTLLDDQRILMVDMAVNLN